MAVISCHCPWAFCSWLGPGSRPGLVSPASKCTVTGLDGDCCPLSPCALTPGSQGSRQPEALGSGRNHLENAPPASPVPQLHVAQRHRKKGHSPGIGAHSVAHLKPGGARHLATGLHQRRASVTGHHGDPAGPRHLACPFQPGCLAASAGAHQLPAGTFQGGWPVCLHSSAGSRVLHQSLCKEAAQARGPWVLWSVECGSRGKVRSLPNSWDGGTLHGGASSTQFLGQVMPTVGYGQSAGTLSAEPGHLVPLWL